MVLSISTSVNLVISRESLPWVALWAELGTKESKLEQLLLTDLFLVRFQFFDIPCYGQQIFVLASHSRMVDDELTVDADEATSQVVSAWSGEVKGQAPGLNTLVVGEWGEGVHDHTTLGVSGCDDAGVNAEDAEVGLLSVQVLIKLDNGKLATGVGADAWCSEGRSHTDEVDDSSGVATGLDEIVGENV